MKYELNGKKINIPDAEIEKSMKLLGLTKEEAIQMYLEDEGHLINEEQNELTAKAKENNITATIHNAKSDEKRKNKPRTVVASDEKQDIFKELHDFLTENFENVTVLKENKLFELKINEKTFKIDLIEQRKKKEVK